MDEHQHILWSKSTRKVRKLTSELFGVDVPLAEIKRWLAMLQDSPPYGGWSNQSVKTWIGLRVSEFIKPTHGPGVDDVRIVVVLHFFNVWIPSVPFAKSLPPPKRYAEDDIQFAKSPITRRLSKIIKPIDKVAARVVFRPKR